MRHMAVSMVTKTPVRPIPALGGEEQRLRFAQAAFLAAQLSSSPGPTFTQTELSSPAFKGPEHTCRVPSNWLTKPLLRESEAWRLNPRPAPHLIHIYPAGQLPQSRRKREGFSPSTLRCPQRLMLP